MLAHDLGAAHHEVLNRLQLARRVARHKLPHTAAKRFIDRLKTRHLCRLRQPDVHLATVFLAAFAARITGPFETVDSRCDRPCRQSGEPGKIAGGDIAFPIDVVQTLHVRYRDTGQIRQRLMKEDAARPHLTAQLLADLAFEFGTFAEF